MLRKTRIANLWIVLVALMIWIVTLLPGAIDAELDRMPSAEVIATAPIRQLPVRDAAPVADKPVVMVMEATAYTHAAPGGDINGTGDGLTATGVPVREGICAVDDTVIPLGTRLHIEGYGEAVAADVGGAIRGMRVDVFLEDKQAAMRWGRRMVEVTVLAD